MYAMYSKKMTFYFARQGIEKSLKKKKEGYKMAKKLFKLVLTGTTTTNAVPTVNRYFYPASAAINTTSFKILATKFFKDNGANAASIVTAVANNGYYLLYVNGELQQSGIYSVTNTAVTIATTAAFTIPASGVVSLAVTNFAPSSTTTITS